MDLLRRVAGGQLAEIFGKAALPLDRENRTLGLREAAEQAAASLDAESCQILDGYAHGVNFYIETHRHSLPLEFTLLDYKPRPWTPADTFLVEGYMWKTLSTTWKAKLNRAKLTAMIGPTRAHDLFVVDSPLDHFLVGAAATGKNGTGLSSRAIKNDSTESFERNPIGAQDWLIARLLLSQFERASSGALGSNNFVVGGAHTYSGKPLLANDTHLSLGVPCIWYIIHLEAPGWNVKGFSLPGAPLVIIGHNQRVAWGFTNSNADVQDLYEEIFNRQNPMEYRVNGAWVRVQERAEVIRVRGEPNEVMNVDVTRHGPIVYRDAEHSYALRWTATDPGGLDFSFPLIGQTQNWSQFLEVMRRLNGPGQNTVYADVDGNIGYVLAAKVPVRKNGNGALPVPGDTDDYEWTGYIPFGDLPQVLNPPGGIIATANARTVGPGYRWYLTDRWAAPYRTARMYQLLSGRKDLRIADCDAVQNDIVSLPNQFLADQLLRAFSVTAPKDPRARALIQGLSDWGGRATADSLETSFLEYTRHTLLKNLLAPYFGAEISRYELWEPASVYEEVWWRDKVFLESVLRERPAAWLPKGFPSYDELLAASADEAVARLAKLTHSSKPDSWQWGRLHQLDMLHPLGRSGPLRWFLSIGPLAEDGTVDTIKAMGNGHGPAMRFVADLANFDDSLMEITPGESGQFGSPHYCDQFPRWFAGRGIPAPFSDTAEARASVHELRLEPSPK